MYTLLSQYNYKYINQCDRWWSPMDHMRADRTHNALWMRAQTRAYLQRKQREHKYYVYKPFMWIQSKVINQRRFVCYDFLPNHIFIWQTQTYTHTQLYTHSYTHTWPQSRMEYKTYIIEDSRQFHTYHHLFPITYCYYIRVRSILFLIMSSTSHSIWSVCVCITQNNSK